MKVYKNVELNPAPIDILHLDSLAACKRWVKANVWSTHIGEWINHVDGFEYATTIGEYYLFVKE